MIFHSFTNFHSFTYNNINNIYICKNSNNPTLYHSYIIIIIPIIIHIIHKKYININYNIINNKNKIISNIFIYGYLVTTSNNIMVYVGQCVVIEYLFNQFNIYN